tara:strand:- start:138 stop:635 length:498 start_codon:yes stop_codon:yes gene_type:complete
MEKRLTTKVKLWTSDFKSDIVNKLQNLNSLDESDKITILEYLYNYKHLEFKKEDIQKRTRVKNTVPFHERCRALRANGEQCTRRKKGDFHFCGTHVKGIPHGEISDKQEAPTQKKVQIWAQEINGIIRHLDKDGNVYDPQDIYQNSNNPKIIAKWSQNGDHYCLN